MKKVIFTLGTLAISVGLFAQIAPISDVKKTMSKGENTGLEVLINKATSSDIAKVFEAKTKDFKGKFIKPEKGNVEYFIDDAKIASISDQPVDIYAYFLQEGENEVLVRVLHRSPNSRWYSGAGIYRNVHLIQKNTLHIKHNGLYISTKKNGPVFSVSVSSSLSSILSFSVSRSCRPSMIAAVM